MIVGASFDTVEEQKAFAVENDFSYVLLSDTGREIGRAYEAEREEGDDYHERGYPRRISYLIDPDGIIVRAYDLTGRDLAAHAGEMLAEIQSRS